MEKKNLELTRAVLRSLEREGLIVSRLDPDGQVRWRITEKGRLQGPNEMDAADEPESALPAFSTLKLPVFSFRPGEQPE
jgi:hypothetical protein